MTYNKAAEFVDKSIPYLILVLVAIVVVDVFFKEFAHQYQVTILAIDVLIVGFFVVDLVFKYQRVRDIRNFLKLYWLDILAIFPFFLILRLFEEVLLLTEKSSLTLRNLFHAGLVLEEGAAEAARTSEILVKEGRLATFQRFFKPFRRMPRFFKAMSFYEHPNQGKTLYH